MALSNVTWKGLKSLEVMLDILPEKLAKANVRKAYKYALEPTKQAMLTLIPKDRTGNLRRSIDITHGGTQQLQQAYAVVGPRRKRFTWNQQGWHSHLVESGTKAHKIPKGLLTSFVGAKKMPVFTKAGFVGFARQINHKGTPGTFPFRRSMDATWEKVADRVADKIAGIMREEIKVIQNQYGNVVTRGDL